MKLSSLLKTISYLNFIGDNEIEITRIVPFDAQNKDQNVLMWVNEKHVGEIAELKNGTLICPPFDEKLINSKCNYIVVQNPRNTFRILLQKWFMPEPQLGIAESAKIHKSSAIGKEVLICEHVVIEENCKIGDKCIIGHNTVIKAGTVLENKVAIGANCTIGGVGFGYEKNEEGNYELIPHIGGVYISEGSEIGNNTCIDRGVINNTFLGTNVKVDNLVHIAHGAHIDKNSLIIANAVVAGSVTIGKNVWVAPSATILNKVHINDNAVIGMGAVVLKNVGENEVIVGNPGKKLEKK